MRFLQDLMTLLREIWNGLLNPDHVLFSVPGVNKYFARCTTCGRVFMHYWGVVTADDRAKGRQVGCVCGGSEMKVCNLPTWQQAYFLFSRYLWRKLIRNERYWDPRVLERVHAK